MVSDYIGGLSPDTDGQAGNEFHHGETVDDDVKIPLMNKTRSLDTAP